MAIHTENYISLYSGAGGLDLGFRLANPSARPVLYVEREFQAAALLVDHIEAELLEPAPVWADSGTIPSEQFVGKVDWVIGGFPCQPWSVAGARAGTDDERWLWPHIERLVRQIRPRGIFVENVPGLFHGGIEHVLGGMASLGFDAEWISVRASDVRAPHRRERVFIMAHTQDPDWRRSEGTNDSGRRAPEVGSPSRESELADTGHTGAQPESISPQERHELRSINWEGSPLDQPDECSGQLANPNDSGSSSSRCRVDRDWSPQNEGRREQSQSELGRHEQELADTSTRSGDVCQRGQCEPAGSVGELANSLGERRRSGDYRRQYAEDAFPPGPSGDWSNVNERYRPAVALESDRDDLELFVQLIKSGKPCPDGEERWHYDNSCVSGEYWATLTRYSEAVESEVRGMDDGATRSLDGLSRVGRLRILGNGVVPQQAALAFRELATRMNINQFYKRA